MSDDTDEIRDRIFRKIAEAGAHASVRRIEDLTISDKCALAICAGCEFEVTSTGIKITEPFHIDRRPDGRLVVYRSAKQTRKP